MITSLSQTYLYTAIVNVIILSTLHWTLKLYGLSPETTKLAFILVMIHNGVAIFLWPASFVLPNMLRACNDVNYTIILSILSMIVFRIGLSLVIAVHFGYGAIGVWIAMVVDWVFRTICFVARYVKGGWKKKSRLSL